jgi:DNA-binding response OmpR family regulator
MTAPHLLIVEDDTEIAEFLATGLAAEGYAVTVRHDARDLFAQVQSGEYALLILDRMLPKAEGVDLCQRLRCENQDLKVLMLTAKDALEDTVEGLRAGADDYMTKPFAFAELLARIEALLRRPAAGQAEQDVIIVGDIQVNLSLKAAYYGDQNLDLTATEFALLRYLAENAGVVASHMDILHDVWGYDFDPHTNIVGVYIAYLRHKLERAGAAGVIRTARGFGYLLSERIR